MWMGVFHPRIPPMDVDEISTVINHSYGETGFQINDILATHYTQISRLGSIYKLVRCCRYVEDERIDTFLQVR